MTLAVGETQRDVPKSIQSHVLVMLPSTWPSIASSAYHTWTIRRQEAQADSTVPDISRMGYHHGVFTSTFLPWL